MQKTEQQLREEIVRIGQLMFEKGWVAANDGNISARLPDEEGEARLLATPTGVCKGMMQPDDMIVTDLDGNRVRGTRNRTSEMEMHTTIYRARPDISAVVHAHPPAATGFAVAGRALNVGVLPEVIVCLGAIPLAEYGEPGTSALCEGMRPYLPKFDALLLANHGAVAYADDLFRAYHRMETVEHSARILRSAVLGVEVMRQAAVSATASPGDIWAGHAAECTCRREWYDAPSRPVSPALRDVGRGRVLPESPRSPWWPPRPRPTRLTWRLRPP